MKCYFNSMVNPPQML